jgi:LPXTG-motif cell wall-anchored protein
MKESSKKLVLSNQFPRIGVLTTLYLLLTTFCFSQTISSSFDRDKILIGEQVTLQLKADVNERNYSLVSWFNFPDTVNHVEVVKRGNIDTVEAGGSISYIQNITITSFDSGLWNLPLFQIVLQDLSSKKQVSFKADTIALQVLPVDVSNLQDYHDIKTIIDVPVQNNTWMIVAIIVSAIILIILLILFFRKRKKKKVDAPQKLAYKGSPKDWAMEQLDALQKEDLISKNQTKLFYTKLDEIYRTYFSMELNINALQLTGDELMIKLKIYLAKENVRTKFYQLMRLSDAVKFAKYIPENSENNEAVSTARETIQFTESEIQQMKKNNAY